MFNTKAFSATSATSGFGPSTIARRDPLDRDVQIDIVFCGICHSDIHFSRNEWAPVMAANYPCVPGHQIVGRVAKVGSGVTRFKSADLVGVGCIIDSDHTCDACKEGLGGKA